MQVSLAQMPAQSRQSVPSARPVVSMASEPTFGRYEKKRMNKLTERGALRVVAASVAAYMAMMAGMLGWHAQQVKTPLEPNTVDCTDLSNHYNEACQEDWRFLQRRHR